MPRVQISEQMDRRKSKKDIVFPIYRRYTAYKVVTVMHYSLVWARALWITVGGKNFPPFFYMWGEWMTELSIFIDESGDFGEVKERPAFMI